MLVRLACTSVFDSIKKQILINVNLKIQIKNKTYPHMHIISTISIHHLFLSSYFPSKPISYFFSSLLSQKINIKRTNINIAYLFLILFYLLFLSINLSKYICYSCFLFFTVWVWWTGAFDSAWDQVTIYFVTVYNKYIVSWFQAESNASLWNTKLTLNKYF